MTHDSEWCLPIQTSLEYGQSIQEEQVEAVASLYQRRAAAFIVGECGEPNKHQPSSLGALLEGGRVTSA